jgi:polyisoprenoid-binding protein YceI
LSEHRLITPDRSWIRWATALVTTLALVFGLALNIAQAQDESTPESDATAGVLEDAPVFIACDENVTAADESDATAIPATSPSMSYALTSDSVARYRAQEELANQGANEAVGETNSIVGQIYFDESGMPLACSRWDVDLRTLTSDESRRDNFLRGNTLQTDTYPVATFVLTSVEGLDGALVDGEETSFALVGNLTMHGVTKLVRWNVTATLDGDTITGTGNTTFNMEDYGITEPKVGPVLSVDEKITLEVDLTATRAA